MSDELRCLGSRAAGDAEAARTNGPSGQRSLVLGAEREWLQKSVRKRVVWQWFKRLERDRGGFECNALYHPCDKSVLSILQEFPCQEKETNFSITQWNIPLSASERLLSEWR